MIRLFHRSPPAKRGEINSVAFAVLMGKTPEARRGRVMKRALSVERKYKPQVGD